MYAIVFTDDKGNDTEELLLSDEEVIILAQRVLNSGYAVQNETNTTTNEMATDDDVSLGYIRLPKTPSPLNLNGRTYTAEQVGELVASSVIYALRDAVEHINTVQESFGQ